MHTGCPIAHNMPGRLSGGLVCRGWHGSPLSLSGCAGGCQAVILPHLPVPRGHIRPPHGLISLHHGGIFVRHMASSPCTTGAYSSTTRHHLPVPQGHIRPPHGIISLYHGAYSSTTRPHPRVTGVGTGHQRDYTFPKYTTLWLDPLQVWESLTI